MLKPSEVSRKDYEQYVPIFYYGLLRVERKNKVARKVEAGIETNKLRSFFKSRDFFTFFFCLFNTQIMEFFFMLRIVYVVTE